MRFLVLSCVLFLLPTESVTQQLADSIALDSDHDGLSDDLESSLLLQFLPHFMISSADCSSRPALFRPQTDVPTVAREDGTIYGQAFPRNHSGAGIELHYYHLWRRDCGEMGHPLDAEHVSVLLSKSDHDHPGGWTASYWYAAAHEDTVCDASQIARAATLDAETHGPRVWISAGKHASFLNQDLCRHGCGGDRCDRMMPLKTAEIINLGEATAPMNGAFWSVSSRWPLNDKLQRTDFTDVRTHRLDQLPNTDVAWANPAKRPAQSVIFGANTGIAGALTGARSTDTALATADNNTHNALGQATANTAHAISGTMHSIGKALRTGAQKTGQALGPE